jgi:transposase InsO family protein
VDNGPEFISKDLDLWAYQNDVTLDFSRPGKPIGEHRAIGSSDSERVYRELQWKPSGRVSEHALVHEPGR